MLDDMATEWTSVQREQIPDHCYVVWCDEPVFKYTGRIFNPRRGPSPERRLIKYECAAGHMAGMGWRPAADTVDA